jgi:hypothetical protein
MSAVGEVGMRTWPFLLALALMGCGARSELPEPRAEPGVLPVYCHPTSSTSVYVVTEQSELFRFDPPSRTFDPMGILDCPSGATPFSMAVDHEGTAYVIFDDGELFEVSTASGSCTATSFSSGGFTPTFGMGFSTDPDGLGETLFIAGVGSDGMGKGAQLGTLDTTAFQTQSIGAFSSDIGDAELTGVGDGSLFAFGVVEGVSGAHLAQIDKTDASIFGDHVVATPDNPTAWAFAFWGGDFYFFTSIDGTDSVVGRFHSADGSFDASYAALPSGAIVGAGVSTCAPQ